MSGSADIDIKEGKKVKTVGKTAAKRRKSPSKTLVIVESPSKAKTIGKMLGSNYKVVASVGHVRDLPKSRLAVDVENNFEPDYISIRGKGDVIKMLKKEAKSASRVYLATDPDREGEAISWHIAYLLGIDVNTPCRIEFNEITKNAIKEAVKKPRPLDMDLVDAQQARRILDRLVGYQLSPLLWRKMSRRGLSAGRVQSAALKILCDREKEIISFVPEEYWTLTADFRKSGKKFSAELTKYKGKKIQPSNKEESEKILEDVKDRDFTVSKVEEKERVRKPSPPHTTSTLQQEASSRLNFNPRKTMQVAQQLYEGIDVRGTGTVGLVTYIRTDSVRISDEARDTVKNMIASDYGSEYLGSGVYSNRKKEVQDAHEAIRPSNPLLHPNDIKASLTNDQFKLYDLIWRRFVASQMSNAVFDSVSADLECSGYTFHATGSKLKFEGFLKVLDTRTESDKQKVLPQLETGEKLKPLAIRDEQHFTQPPPRYTEASLVKELEDKGIGRPSTYAPIVTTLTDRRYVKREKKTLVPQELGMQVNSLMEAYFKDVVDSGFTALMEGKLDSIEVDGNDWHNVISDFYSGFSKDLKVADESIEKVEAEDEPTGEMCPECGKPLIKKHGRFGDFIACSGYPDCRYTANEMVRIGVSCPKCGKELVEKKSRKGRIFYGCSGYPDCSQVYWNRPVDRKCPRCGALMTEKKGKNTSFECSNTECRYRD